MERRVLLAVALMLLVAILPSLLSPPKRTVRQPGSQAAGGDTSARRRAPAGSAAEPTAILAPAPATIAVPADTVTIETSLYRYRFSTLGARMVEAELTGYRSLSASERNRPVQLVPQERPLLGLSFALGTAGGGGGGGGGDTISLAQWAFQPSARRVAFAGDSAVLTFTGSRGPGLLQVELTYVFRRGEYLFDVGGRVTGLGPAGAVLSLDLGDGLKSVEADSMDDFRNFAVVTKAGKTESDGFGSVDPGEIKVLSGPFEWVALKTKYFLVAALAIDEGFPRFGGALMVGAPRTGKVTTRAALSLTLPVPPDGRFRYQVYAGPMENRRLTAIGHDLDDVNPYGWIFRPIVRPVAVFVTEILIWMHERVRLSYGWVLVIFGLLVRILLWPLNQKAMESGIRMQAVQPHLKAIQERYKNDPQKLQQEMVKLYREHKVNPFGGCLPLLIPMPVLLALFFVFANTIEFRGVPFLWLPDLSLRDPLYIIPILMGLSMYALTRMGQIGLPPNPQAKMMLYVMPLFMTVLFLNFSSGLNLYYAASNVFSIPQQYLIAKRRLREQGGKPAEKRP